MNRRRRTGKIEDSLHLKQYWLHNIMTHKLKVRMTEQMSDIPGMSRSIRLDLMTGLAIVTYLNQQPYEPRERDYSYAASFYAFSIWIGLGVLYLIDLLKTRLKMKEMAAIIVVTLVSTLLVPVIVAKENWHDHDRSRKYSARDFAADYLNSCDKQAILFTNGDNDTFPLWYNP